MCASLIGGDVLAVSMAPSGPEACARELVITGAAVAVEFQWPLLGLRRAHCGIYHDIINSTGVSMAPSGPEACAHPKRLRTNQHNKQVSMAPSGPEACALVRTALSTCIQLTFQWPLLGLRRAHLAIQNAPSELVEVSMAPSGPEACARGLRSLSRKRGRSGFNGPFWA